MNQRLTQQRIRITHGKYGALRFVGHLDLALTWERVLRRAEIPLEYTQGFNPRPRLQFAAALPVGVTSESEFLDVWLTERLDGDFPGDWIARLMATVPSGLPVTDLVEIPIEAPALPPQVSSAEYVITLADTEIDEDALAARAADLLAQPEIIRPGRKKPYDLRPLIFGLSMNTDGSLIAHLKAGEHGNARPDELLAALGLGLHEAHVHRRRLILGDSA